MIGLAGAAIGIVAMHDIFQAAADIARQKLGSADARTYGDISFPRKSAGIAWASVIPHHFPACHFAMKILMLVT